MSNAFIFPGQGSQKHQMGQDFFNSFPIAKKVYECVDDTLNYKLSKIIFDGTDEELTLTTHAQPALMATSIAILQVLIQETGKKIDELCSVVAGHSLGEYTALCAAEALSLEDTTKLLDIRANSMQKACPQDVGAMAACIGISLADLTDVLNHTVTNGVCQIANDNVEGQIVISGHEPNVDRVIATLKDTGYKAIKLKVSAPFHSELIKSAEVPMSEALDKIEIKIPKVKFICNFTADVASNPVLIKQNLINQISGAVRWRETMYKFSEYNVNELVEIGSGKVLSGLAKKSSHDYIIHNISNIEDLKQYLVATDI